MLGSKKHVIPDIAIFVNGLPLAIIECKSPTKGDGWKSEAVQQLHRYQELGTRWKGQGAPKLFEAAQILVGTCGERAVYGTVGTAERFFLEWKEPYPLGPKQLEDQLGRPPTPQDILLYGLLERRNLLDIIRNFVVFEVESGRTARKLTRYRQFIAVSEAMRRIRTANKPSARGGIVWHTQGSGKSLSMLWLALKLRRDPSQQQPTIVIVTDRTKLDGQIAGVFTACGFPNPERADSVRHLRRILEHPTGKTVMTTIQKFQDITGSSATPRNQSVHPTLSEATNIFVMVDEAHRTQYRSLAANMRQALPNACFLGFTGTPIDKKDRSTLRTFGPYIDTYTIEQAVRDKATVPIFYESRLPALQIIGQTIDKVFDHVFADRSDDERAAIKQRFATESAIAGAPRRIEAICLDLIEHFTKFIAPNGFKAQVVATSRHAAVTYKEALDRLNGPESALLMSSGHNDEERLARWHLSKEQQDRLIERFKDPGDPLSILVVCDMLLTGFDAPVEQVMYLDAALKEHTLLQAIARVNRPHGDEKTYGLVVDYWGVSVELSEALAVFSATDVQGALTPNMDELPRLQSRHAAAMRFFHAVEDTDDLHACVRVLEPEDVRAEFDLAFRRFSQSMDMLLPDRRALPYQADLRWLGKIRLAARARYRDDRLDLSGCGEKVRKLIADAVAADGIEILVREVQLFSPEFDEKVEALKTDDAKASEMEHAIRHEINVRVEENPVFYESLRKRLEEIIEQHRLERLDAAEQFKLFASLRGRASGGAVPGAGHWARGARLRHLRTPGAGAADGGSGTRRPLQRRQPRSGVAHRRVGHAFHGARGLVGEGRRAAADAEQDQAASARQRNGIGFRWSASPRTSWISPRCGRTDDGRGDLRRDLGRDGTVVHDPPQSPAEEDGGGNRGSNRGHPGGGAGTRRHRTVGLDRGSEGGVDRAADPARRRPRSGAFAARVRQRRERALSGPALPAESESAGHRECEAAGRLASGARGRGRPGPGGSPG